MKATNVIEICPCQTMVEDPGPHIASCVWADEDYEPCAWCLGKGHRFVGSRLDRKTVCTFCSGTGDPRKRSTSAPTCGIAAGIHADDELCTLPEAHDGPCSHGIPRDV